jgi:K+-sensing histidine kinase KdpD
MEKTLAEKLTESALGNDIINIPKDVTKEAEKENHLMKPYDPKSHSEYIELKRFEIEQANESSERKLRQENAKKAFIFSSTWAIFIAAVILLHGFGVSYKFFILSQTEFLFIIGTLTTSIFAFYTLVLRYLFYRKPGVKNS